VSHKQNLISEVGVGRIQANLKIYCVCFVWRRENEVKQRRNTDDTGEGKLSDTKTAEQLPREAITARTGQIALGLPHAWV